jgi:CHAD domain-containing protein
MADTIGFRDYGAKVIRERLVQMLSHAHGVRLGEDTEALHQMRVASRRLRAAISMFEPAFGNATYRKFEREVKSITDALGVARDLDVMIEALRKLDTELPDDERMGMDSFISEREVARGKCQSDIVRALEQLEEADLLSRLDAIVLRAHATSENTSSDLPAKAAAERA